MQQYRINYKLLIGLFVGSIVSMIALYFLWSWQVNRKATWYRDTALEAIDAGDQLKAFEYQEKFVQLRREDDEARVRLASIAHDVLKLEGVPRDQQGKAFAILSETVRRTSDVQTRRYLADFLMQIGQSQQAVVHYEELLKTSGEPELKSKLIQSLYRAKDYKSAMTQAFELLGYDPESESFDSEKAEATDQPEVYWTLSSILYDREDNPELAREVIDQMITNNPDNAVAHLYKSYFLFGTGETEEAKEVLEEAYKLDSKNSDILYQRALSANIDEDRETVRSLSDIGITEFPEEMRFYQLKSKALIGLKEPAEAVAVLDEAISRFGKTRSIMLMADKLELLLTQKDYEAAKGMVEELEDLRLPQLQALIDFQKANFEYSQQNWAKAANLLRKVRTELVGLGNYQLRAGAMLGSAYEELGKLDLAREIYGIVLGDETAVGTHPVIRAVRARLARIDRRLDRKDGAQSGDLNEVVRRMLELPERQQDWSKIDDMITELEETSDLSKARAALMRAGVFRLRGKMEEAKDLVRTAASMDPNDTSVMYEAAKIQMQEPPDGPRKAVKLLERVESKSGVSYMSRSLLTEAVWLARDENISNDLSQLAEGIGELKDSSQSNILRGIAGKFLNLGDREQATSFLERALDSQPGDLPLLMMLFEIAYDQRDDAAMQDAQSGILDVVGSKEDGNYVLTEAKRRLIRYRGDTKSRENLEEALSMVEDALKVRPEWHELHIVYGQLLLVLGRDIDLALEHFDSALEFGPPDFKTITVQTKLLFDRGLIEQARRRMDLIPEKYRTQLLGTVEADLLMASDDPNAAFESAKKTADAQPENSGIQSWFGSIALDVDKPDVAAAAFRKAAEINPKAQDVWMKLLGVHAREQDFDKLEGVLRDAQLALEPDIVPLVQAKNYELRGQWPNAEKIYESLFGGDYETNPVSAQKMAQFYLLWARIEPEKLPLSFEYLNHILRAGYEGTLPSDSPVLVWARERAADYLAATREYPNAMKALKLLRQGGTDGAVPSYFLDKYVTILASQGDPESLLEAINILAGLYPTGKLDKANQLLLAKLYKRTNRWEQGKDLMLDVLSRYGRDKEVWTTYISMLIEQGEYNNARSRINRFADIADDSVLVARLKCSLGQEKGDKQYVRDALREVLPSKSLQGALTPQELEMIRVTASLATTYGEHEFAEKLLRLYVSRRKTQGIFELMTVVALHGNIDDAIGMLGKVVDKEPMRVARIVIQALRDRRTELSKDQQDQLWNLLTTVIGEAPNEPTNILMQAEAYEITEQYEEAISAYEKALSNRELQSQQKAVALNNLAYLLGQTGQNLDQAEQMIGEAIRILGPLADIMDTRAVIRMARKEYELATEDMKLALAVDPSAAKYYHMARAEALAGHGDEAIQAWEKASDLKIAKEDLPLLEQPGYEETERLIEQLKSRSL